MQAGITTENGERTDVWMGCYGLGISRLIGSVVEQLGDVSGKMVWPSEIAPFTVHLLDLTPEKVGEKLYSQLLQTGMHVLYDDRSGTPGEKFADADLIGSPIRLIISKRSLGSGGIEMVDLITGNSSIIPVEEVVTRISNKPIS